jgi:hypothetical protein
VARKTLKLITAIEENYCILGIASDEPDYKLCWLINHSLSTRFEKIENLELFHKKAGEEQQFPLFYYHDENSLLTYRIIKNRSDNGFFLEEFKNLDYIVHIQGEIFPEEIEQFIQRVSKIDSIRLCVPVDLRKIKNRIRLELW